MKVLTKNRLIQIEAALFNASQQLHAIIWNYERGLPLVDDLDIKMMKEDYENIVKLMSKI